MDATSDPWEESVKESWLVSFAKTELLARGY